MFSSVTSATVTSSTAMIEARIGTPCAVPFTSASTESAGGSGSTSFASSSRPASKGIISAATAIAAGVLMMAADRILPSASGITGPRMVA